MPRSEEHEALYDAVDSEGEKPSTAGLCARRVAILVVIAASFSVGLTLIFGHRAKATPPLVMQQLRPYIAPGCSSPVFCQGDLLAAVQTSGIFNDSKSFVDMVIKPSFTEQDVLSAFGNLTDKSSFVVLSQFVATYFDESYSYVQSVTPRDFVANPPFLQRVNDPKLRAFGLAVHSIWNSLVKQFTLPATQFPSASSYSAIVLPRPFVVPGGRFREFYYWDSWWVLQGLLVSNLTDTARDIVDNFLDLVDTYGFVPNGARIYYLDRSQPPVLPLVVSSYVNATGGAYTASNQALLARAVPLMKREQDFWWTEVNTVRVTLPSGDSHRMFRYNTNNTSPRPESYLDDWNDHKDAANATTFYRNIAAGAETGWDFSTRWILNNGNRLVDIATDRVVPIDLNAIMLRGAEIIADLASAVGNDDIASNFTDRATLQRESFRQVFNWSAWSDVVLSANYSSATPSKQYYAAIATVGWVPSIAALLSAGEQQAIATILNQRLQVGGLKTSDIESGQQWDGDNAWPPLQYFAKETFMNFGMKDLASNLVTSFVSTTYCGYQATGKMLEKYNTTSLGGSGSGGEYTPQTGFGWTNGVLLSFLNDTTFHLSAPTAC